MVSHLYKEKQIIISMQMIINETEISYMEAE